MIPRVEYGQTGIIVSRLCVGTGQMGPDRFGLSPIAGGEFLRRCYDRGVTFWDTALLYQTHPHVAAGLRGLPRERVQINSKTRALDFGSAMADVERSLAEIGTDYVDTFLLHNVSSVEDLGLRAGAHEALLVARDRGLCRAIGVSTHLYTGELLHALQRRADIEVVLALYNRIGLGLRGGGVVEHARLLGDLYASGKGVTAMKVIGDGALAGQAVAEMRAAFAAPFLSAVCVGIYTEEQLEVATACAVGGEPSPAVVEKAARQADGPWGRVFGQYEGAVARPA